MIEHDYFCNNCMTPYGFSESEESSVVICPVCNNKMEYWCSVEIDDETHLVTKKWWDEERKKSHPENKSFRPTTPTVTCPYCKSTNTEKISGTSKVLHGLFFGVHAIGRNAKEWHCNTCDSDF